MDDFEKHYEVLDPQERRIFYSHSEILHRILQFGFPETVPQHFATIFTKPDVIYMDKRNKVHCYQKKKGGKMYTISTIEVEEFGEKFFSINSWFEEKDDTIKTIEYLAEAQTNEELNKQVRKKINESKSWMKILYEDVSYLKAKKYQKRGIKVVEKNKKNVVQVPGKKGKSN